MCHGPGEGEQCLPLSVLHMRNVWSAEPDTSTAVAATRVVTAAACRSPVVCIPVCVGGREVPHCGATDTSMQPVDLEVSRAKAQDDAATVLGPAEARPPGTQQDHDGRVACSRRRNDHEAIGRRRHTEGQDVPERHRVVLPEGRPLFSVRAQGHVTDRPHVAGP